MSDKIKALLCFSIILLSCSGPKFPQNRVENFDIDVNFCGSAQLNLNRLNCEQGNPTKKGMTFEDLCRDLEEKRIFVNAECISKITTCADVDSCTGSK